MASTMMYGDGELFMLVGRGKYGMETARWALEVQIQAMSKGNHALDFRGMDTPDSLRRCARRWNPSFVPVQCIRCTAVGSLDEWHAAWVEGKDAWSKVVASKPDSHLVRLARLVCPCDGAETRMAADWLLPEEPF